MSMRDGPTVEEMRRGQLAEEEHRRAMTDAAWPAHWRAGISQSVLDLVDVNRELRDRLEVAIRAINELGAKEGDLRRRLAAEITAREGLEALPRQSITVNVPERQAVTNIDVPATNVSVNVPTHETVTDVEYGVNGRILRTRKITGHEVPDETVRATRTA